MLSGRIQIDETFYPVPASELERDGRGRVKPGFSRNKLCIAAATDGRGRSVAVPCGRGKPSGARALAAYGPHIERGSTLVHDRENALRDVNRLHFLLQAFLDRHRGFDRGRLPGWLDLFSVVVNPPEGAMSKAAAVLDRAMASPKTLRYRDFYGGGRR